jgi:uncharacterized membrane protein
MALARFHVLTSGRPVANRIELRQIAIRDVFDALRMGLQDFLEKPSHYVLAVILYPVIGLALFLWASHGNALHLIYPMVGGFTLIGPIAALGLYEISRRREAGRDASWRHAFAVLLSPAIPSITAMGVWLLVLFLGWIRVAAAIFDATFGGVAYAEFGSLLDDVLTTRRGLTLVVLGNLAGLMFALVTLCTTVIAFPLLLDRDVGALAAALASACAVARNPVPLMTWGLIVAGLMFLGALPALVGLIVVLPVLGHATWHLYRKLVPDIGA